MFSDNLRKDVENAKQDYDLNPQRQPWSLAVDCKEH